MTVDELISRSSAAGSFGAFATGSGRSLDHGTRRQNQPDLIRDLENATLRDI